MQDLPLCQHLPDDKCGHRKIYSGVPPSSLQAGSGRFRTLSYLHSPKSGGGPGGQLLQVRVPKVAISKYSELGSWRLKQTKYALISPSVDLAMIVLCGRK